MNSTIISKLLRSIVSALFIFTILFLVSGASTVQAQIFDLNRQARPQNPAQARGPGEKFLFATGNENGIGGTPGEVICIGGFPAGGFCSPGTKRIHVRGATRSFVYTNLSGDAADMFDGVDNIVINCNWNENYAGPCWGTFEWFSESRGGKWEGSYTAEIDLFNVYVSGQLVGHGSGGDLEGLQVKVDLLYPGSPVGTFTARVLTHKSK